MSLIRKHLGGLVLAVGGLLAAVAPASAASQGRIWFYQQFLPGEAMGGTAVMLNGAVIGTSAPGQRFYRDVAPGTYHLSVASVGVDANQERDVVLAPGQELYVKIASLRSWASQFSFMRDTFYVWPMPTGAALIEIAQSTF